MRNPGFQHRIYRVRLVEPRDELLHFGLKATGIWCLEVYFLFSNGPGDDLHLPSSLRSPLSDGDTRHAGSSGGKQSCVPSEEPFLCQLLAEISGRVEQHLDDAFHIATCSLETSDIEPQASSD